VNKYGPIYNGTLDPTPLVNTLVANFTTALNTIAGPPGSPTGVKVVVGNVGDWGVMPFTAAAGYTDPAQNALVTHAVNSANAQIIAIAHARGMPVVDVFGLLNLGLGPSAPVIGGFAMTLGAPPSDNQAYFFGPDKIHPGTLWQGLLANTIIAAANEQYGTSLTPFTDQQLLSYAGIADPNGGTVTSHYAVDGYVLLPVPEPATSTLIVLALFALMPLRRRICRSTR
jgi:hypothetical protein